MIGFWHVGVTIEALFTEIARNQALQRDIIAVGYRRKQLKKFEALLNDSACFAEEQRQLNTTPEGVCKSSLKRTRGFLATAFPFSSFQVSTSESWSRL